MSDNPELKPKHDDDIDLLDLFSRLGRSVGRVMKAVGRGILYIFFFLIRKWFLLALSLALGAGVSYLLKFSTERFYTSDITLRSNTIPNVEMIDYVNKLHKFSREKNIEQLASALSVATDKVKYIKNIQAFWIIDLGRDGIPDLVDLKDRHNVLDTINVRMQDRFLVRVKTTIPQELSAIRDGIISYIETNTFFQDQNILRIKQAEDLLARLNYDVEQLDSLQKVKYFEESRRLKPGEGGQMIFLQEYKTQLLHDDIYRLIQQKQTIERIKTIYSDLITLISDFTPPAKPDNGALYYGKVVIPLIFILAIIILLVIDNRKQLSDAFKKY